jgi:hypothetical protein
LSLALIKLNKIIVLATYFPDELRYEFAFQHVPPEQELVLGFEDKGARLFLTEDRLNQEDPHFF